MEMKQLVSSFPDQLREAIAIGKKAKLKKTKTRFSNVVIAGLGGSGIGGTIVSELVSKQAYCPISVCKGYFLPGYVSAKSLVVISSYSGNTEETLACMKQALKKKAVVVCVTSGGEVEKIARKKKLDLVVIPGGKPPRACLGYSLTQLFYILAAKGVIKNNFQSDLNRAVALLDGEHSDILTASRKVASLIHNRTPIIYATSNFEGVAVRFRQQLNENAKILCGHHVIPEMNHNELVGWPSGSEKIAVIFLRDRFEYERNNARIEINKSVISQYTSHITEIWSRGKSQIEKAIYFIHFVDWVSVWLSELRGVDAMEVRVIDRLKGELSSL